MRTLLLALTALLALSFPARADDLAEADRWWGANVSVASFVTADGVSIRYARYSPPSPKGSLVFFTGRTEPLEKYAESLHALRSLPVALYVYEHRGQGGSSRPLPDREKGHVADWRLYVEDARR
ncbi:MAG: alpha/beta hydrolase, partial [Nitrospinae bacterium]|nr:alpha/beta hydrolase [Nitrospinota bacterium]